MPIGILVALIVVIVAFLLVALAGVGAQKAPARNTLIVVSVISGFVDSGCLWDMVSMGTLVAFAVVSIAVPVLRAKGMSEPKGFQVPFGPYLIPVLSVLACLAIESWFRFYWHDDQSVPYSGSPSERTKVPGS